FLESIIRLFFGFMIVSFITVPCYYVLLAMEYQIAYEHPGELISTIGFVALAVLVYYLWGKWEKLLWGHTFQSRATTLQSRQPKAMIVIDR
ncbi:hypothetical protein ACR9NC_06805, partial [Helicobacter pylori]